MGARERQGVEGSSVAIAVDVSGAGIVFSQWLLAVGTTGVRLLQRKISYGADHQGSNVATKGGV